MSDPPQTAPPAPGGRFEAVARHLDGLRERGRRGELAELRRVGRRPEDVPPAAFWSLAERHGISPGEEALWLSILPLMVRLPHHPGARPGAALARARVSAARVERWLRLDADSARREAGRLFFRVDGADWALLGPLLRSWSDDARRDFARDFFRTLARQAREATPHDGASA